MTLKTHKQSDDFNDCKQVNREARLVFGDQVSEPVMSVINRNCSGGLCTGVGGIS